jgi:hypothetical protein
MRRLTGMSKTYNFQEQVELQKEYYNLFKEWLLKREKIAEVWDGTLEEDKNGIDLHFRTKNDEHHTAQVKVDFKADTTGNLPFEVLSRAYLDKESKIGSLFDYRDVDFFYFILAESHRIFGFKSRTLLKYVIEHYNEFRNFKADNGDYQTLGCLVPIEKIRHLAIHTLNLTKE